MFKPVRVVATLILFASIIMIFVAAFPLDEPFLCISAGISRLSFGFIFTDPLDSLCHHTVSRLYVVHPFLHPLRSYRGKEDVRDGLMRARQRDIGLENTFMIIMLSVRYYLGFTSYTMGTRTVVEAQCLGWSAMKFKYVIKLTM